MSFTEELKAICEEVRGSRAALVMSLDGISVARHINGEGGPDVETLIVEMVGPLCQAVRGAANTEGGSLKEMMLAFDNGCLLVRMLRDEYFAALYLDPADLAGKGRYALRRHSLPLLKELS